MADHHCLVRTNEKGVKGIFRCINCGRTDLPAEAVQCECDNMLGRTQEQSLLAVIRGDKN
jgi:hypothetical protein